MNLASVTDSSVVFRDGMEMGARALPAVSPTFRVQQRGLSNKASTIHKGKSAITAALQTSVDAAIREDRCFAILLVQSNGLGG